MPEYSVIQDNIRYRKCAVLGLSACLRNGDPANGSACDPVTPYNLRNCHQLVLLLGQCQTLWCLSEQDNLGLLEVASCVCEMSVSQQKVFGIHNRTFIDKDQTQVVSRRVLLVDFAESGCEVEAAEEQPDGDCLSWDPLAMRSDRELRYIPRDGEPSMISKRTNVSLSLYWLGAAPVVSLRMMESSMCLIFNRTRRKYILPTMTSFKWYFDLEYSNSMCKQSSIPTSILMLLFVSGGIRYE
jgi:hypothetical protein